MQQPRELVYRDIQQKANQNASRWTDKDDDYWLKRLMQEVGELASVLADDHEDTVEHELLQIASIAANWLVKRAIYQEFTNASA